MPTPLSCNATLATGLVCNAPKNERQKFCKKCTTRIRVARLRAKTAPLDKLKTKVENAYQRERRSAISSVPQLREVGRDTDYIRAKEIENACADARRVLRAESTKLRRELKRQRKDAWRVVLSLSKQIKALTPALETAIAESDAAIRKQ